MSKKLYLPLLMALLVIFTGCKKMGPLSADYFTVNPNPLEVVGGEVPATITGKFPAKYFNKKAVVTVTPYLVYEGGETAAAPFVYQGEKVEGNNQAISYKMGGNITMKTSFKYIPAMRKSDLYLAFQVKKGSKTYDLPRVKIAEGVIATAELCGTSTPSIAPDKFQRIIKENYKANILFLIQQANLRSSELNSQEMKDLQSELIKANEAENKEIVGVNISSYASPDGGLDLNTKLAEQRENNTTKFLTKQLKKDNINADIEGEFTAEDWAGFQELVEKSNIQDKELILRVLSMYKDPEEREREIKNMSATFKVLAEEILPKLRASRITATINLIGKSDEEISKLASSNPKELNVEELLYADTLVNTDAQKLAIYNKAVEIYPNDFRAYNNIGAINLAQGKIADATSWFQKANRLNPSAPETQLNLGLVSLAKNDVAAAEQAFGRAAGAPELGAAMGSLYAKKGEYTKAVNSFSNASTNNAALAQILAKDYNKAKNTLASIQNPDATTAYLKAVLSARTNNAAGVLSNLKESIKLDPSMAAMAASDLEFAKFDISSVAK